MNKKRLSASVDSKLLTAVEQRVSRGKSESVSAWVNDALRLKLEHDRRLDALAAFIKDYESQFGEITADEMRQAARRVRSRSAGHGGSKKSKSGQLPTLP